MGKLKQFSILFNDNPNAVFHPGQAVSGSVVVDLNAPMNMKCIEVNFKGKAYVHWTEEHGSGDNRRTEHYSAKEKYFDITITPYGKGSGGSTENEKQIRSGQNLFPFTFQLPNNLPTSFEGKHGHVRYSIRATINKPWKFNHNTKVALTVLDMIDLNQDPNAKEAVTANDSKRLCCWCCKSGPIQAEVHLDRRGYVPGEFILVDASVENLSSSDMPGTSASIVQYVTFHATTKSRTTSHKTAKVQGQGCRRGQSISWNKERLQIPPLPPSHLRYCKIIDINYCVEFCVVVPTGSFNLKVPVPISLGSIPLQGLTPYNNLTQPSVPPVDASATLSQPSAPAMPQLPAPPPEYQPPPPSYAAALGGGVSIKDEDDNNHLMGQTSYAPQYAYYDWSQSAFTYK